MITRYKGFEYHEQKNSIMFKFDNSPKPEVKKYLIENGFKYNYAYLGWIRIKNENALTAANKVLLKIIGNIC